MTQYYYRVFGLESGPVSLESLREEISAERVCGTDEFRRSTDTDWMRVADLDNHTTIAKNQRASEVLSWDGGHDDIEVQGGGTQPPSPRLSTPSDAQFVIPTTVNRVIVQEPLPLIEAEIRPAETPHFEASEMSTALSKGATSSLASETLNHEPRWFVKMGQVERGPMDIQKLSDLVIGGHILPLDRVRREDSSEWSVASSIPGLFSSAIATNSNVSASKGGRSHSVPSTSSRLPWPVGKNGALSVTRADMPPAPVSRTGQHVDLYLPGTSHESSSVPMIGGQEPPTNSSRSFSEPSSVSSNRRPEVAALAGGNQIVEPETLPPESDLEPRESKHKRRRGQFQEPLLIRLMNRRNFNLIACAGMASMLYALLGPGRFVIGDYSYPYRELRGYFSMLDAEWSRKPAMEFWTSTMAAKNYARKIESIVEKVKKMRSRHAIRDEIISAGECMVQAIMAPSSDDVTSQLDKARQLLKGAERQLIAADKGQQNS